MPAEQSIWKKEIKLRRERPATVHSLAEARSETLPPPASSAPQVALEPRFRRIDVLSRLLDEYADEFPDRVDERRKMLARLADSAEDGILPPDLDGVVHTLFYDLLRRGLKPAPFWKRENSTPKPRKAPAQQTEPTSIWKQEISLGRSRPKTEKVVAPKAEPTSLLKKEISFKRAPKPKEPKLEEASAPKEPKAEQTSLLKKEISFKRAPKPKPEEAPATPAESEQKSFLKKEISFGRSPKPKEPQVEVAAEPKSEQKSFLKKEISFGRSRAPKAPKPAEESKPVEKSGLRREVKLPKPSLPSFSGISLPTFRRSNEVSKIVGLRIGSSQLAAALVNNNGSTEVQKLARSPLERGIIAGGEVRDPDALADALKRFFSQHRLPRRDIRLGVATNRIGVRMLEVPVMDDARQLANAIRFRAQEVLPIPIAEAVLDHIVVGEAIVDGEAQHRVLLVFAHRDLVDGYVDACNRARLKLLGIDFDAFALLRALADDDQELEEPRAALIAVSIGHERTIFAVSDGKICDFARVLEWGGSSLDVAIARALEIEPEAAEQLKQQLTLNGEIEIEGVSPMQIEAARAAIKQELQLLARELVSSLQFYQSRPGSLDIGEMLLTGGGAQLDGIDGELSRQLGVPVRLGDPLHRVKLGKDVPHPASPSLTIAVGLGIEEKNH
jgi:type IV pilus assembly protein PilM